MNFNNAGYTICTAPQMGPHYDQKKNRLETRTFMSYSGEKKKKQMLSLGQTKEFTKSFSWTGVGGKYFTVLVAPVNNEFQKVNYLIHIYLLFLARNLITFNYLKPYVQYH